MLKLLIFLCFLIKTIHLSSSSLPWIHIQRCIGIEAFTCPGQKLKTQFDRMTRVNCLHNCDKYFHCKGNYNAVYLCDGNRANNIHIAKKISDCRESVQTDADTPADQAANLFGRNGGNCEKKYLCANRCSYNLNTRTCIRC